MRKRHISIFSLSNSKIHIFVKLVVSAFVSLHMFYHRDITLFSDVLYNINNVGSFEIIEQFCEFFGRFCEAVKDHIHVL